MRRLFVGSASLGKLWFFSLWVPLLARVKHLTTEISRKPLDQDASGKRKAVCVFSLLVPADLN